MDENELIYYGGEVKALGDGRVGGYLVRYGDPKNTDLEGDFFTAGTDYGVVDGGSLPIYYQHGLDGQMKNRRIGRGTLKFDDAGLWLEAQLEMRDEYEKMIYQMAESGKLGWSSGAAGHLVERKQIGKAYHIKSWPIAEGSLTPTPAEPRNQAIPIKSMVSDADQPAGQTAAHAAKENNMDGLEEIKTLLADNNKTLEASFAEKVEAAAKAAVEKVLDGLPEEKPSKSTNVKVTKDEADQPFERPGDFFMAVKNAAFAPEAIDSRLKGLRAEREAKATGFNEAVPSQGGFLVPEQVAAGIIEKVYETGTLSGMIARDPVQGNTMAYNKVDENSRVDGKRWGGITAYWAAEAGLYQPSRADFSQLELKVKKVTALCVATDEQLDDAPVLESWIMRTAPTEIRFKVEDAILNGDGVGKPFGVYNSLALKSAVRTDANKIQTADIGRMWAARYVGAKDYVWLGNQTIFPELLTLTVGNMPVFLPAGGLSGLPYATLFGRPYFDIEYNPALGGVGDLTLMSPSQYQMIEKAGGIKSASSIHVYFTTGEQAFRFDYRVDGAPIWDSTLTLKDGTTTVSPFVVLAAST